MGGASCLSPFFSSAAELFGAKHFSRMTPRGKNEPACFGKSCWQFPVEVAEGRDQAGISSPHSLCKLCALRKFRPNVVLRGPSSLGWVWLQVDASASHLLFWMGGAPINPAGQGKREQQMILGGLSGCVW